MMRKMARDLPKLPNWKQIFHCLLCQKRKSKSKPKPKWESDEADDIFKSTNNMEIPNTHQLTIGLEM